jgi:hypothetical protein
VIRRALQEGRIVKARLHKVIRGNPDEHGELVAFGILDREPQDGGRELQSVVKEDLRLDEEKERLLAAAREELQRVRNKSEEAATQLWAAVKKIDTGNIWQRFRKSERRRELVNQTERGIREEHLHAINYFQELETELFKANEGLPTHRPIPTEEDVRARFQAFFDNIQKVQDTIEK